MDGGSVLSRLKPEEKRCRCIRISLVTPLDLLDMLN